MWLLALMLLHRAAEGAACCADLLPLTTPASGACLLAVALMDKGCLPKPPLTLTYEMLVGGGERSRTWSSLPWLY